MGLKLLKIHVVHLETTSWSVFDNRKPLVLFGSQSMLAGHSFITSYVNISQSFAPSSRGASLHGAFEAMFGHHK